MCIKRLFCINHKLKLVAYKEALTDDGEILSKKGSGKTETFSEGQLNAVLFSFTTVFLLRYTDTL